LFEKNSCHEDFGLSALVPLNEVVIAPHFVWDDWTTSKDQVFEEMSSGGLAAKCTHVSQFQGAGNKRNEHVMRFHHTGDCQLGSQGLNRGVIILLYLLFFKP